MLQDKVLGYDGLKHTLSKLHGKPINADSVTFDNSETELESTNVKGAIDELFISVSEGKRLIASTITDMGVETEVDADYDTLSENIKLIRHEYKYIAGRDWWKGKMPESRQWISVAYGNGVFVAVSNKSTGTDTGVYSLDGVSWKEMKFPTATNLQTVSYGNGKFVAIPYKSNIAFYSSNGIDWNQTSLPASEAWIKVIYGSNRFIVVGQNSNTYAYSLDGIEWISSKLPITGSSAIGYGDGKFVVMGYLTNTAAYSSDGIDWTVISSLSQTSRNYYECVYGKGRFIAVAANTDVVIYSDDAVTWHEVKLPVSKNWYSAAYGDGKFVVPSYSDVAAYSYDGENWMLNEFPVSNNWRAITYGDGKFVVVAYNSDTFAYSYTGDDPPVDYDWTYKAGRDWWESSIENDNTLKQWFDISYGAGKFVTLNYGTNIGAYSTDGIKWTTMTLPINGYWYQVSYVNDKFVAFANLVGKSGVYSYDGINWLEMPNLPRDTNGVHGVCYGNGVYVTTTNSASLPSLYSYDGINWKESIGFNDVSTVLVYGNGRFIAFARYLTSAGKVFCSSDGINWTTETINVTAIFSSVVFANGKFVAVIDNSDGINPAAYYSYDGIAWYATDFLKKGQWRSISYGNGRFITIDYGNTNVAFYSDDGIHWIETTLPQSGYWLTSAYGDGRFVALSYRTDVVAVSYNTDTPPVSAIIQAAINSI